MDVVKFLVVSPLLLDIIDFEAYVGRNPAPKDFVSTDQEVMKTPFSNSTSCRYDSISKSGLSFLEYGNKVGDEAE